MSRKKTTRGFTIVELLVVVAVITMLSSFMMASLSNVRKKGRDTARVETMNEFQKGLALYMADTGIYPICDKVVINGLSDCFSIALFAGKQLTAVPVDPLGSSNGLVSDCGVTSGKYIYCYVSSGTDYILEYSLETDTIFGKSAGWQMAKP